MRSGRQIGPLGTAARVLGGVIAIAVPVALHGFTPLEAVIALVALPVVAAIAGRIVGPRVQWWTGCCLLCGIALVNAAIVAPTSANGNVTIWVWLGASMLVAAAGGYRGCEVLAIPNVLTGRRDQVGCFLFTPIDAAESRRRTRTAGAA